MAKNNARMRDISTLISAGINPKTGLPIKALGQEEINNELYTEMQRLLTVVDVQDAINRYRWHNLPSGLDTQLLERVLYFKAQGIFFYMKANDKFYFLPYALDGRIDVYGRFLGVTPLPFNGSTNDTSAKKDGKVKPWIQGLTRIPQYEPVLADEITAELMENACVIINDYTIQMAQSNIPRFMLQKPVIDLEAHLLPYLRTGLSNSTGIEGMRVNNEDEQSNVEAANRSIEHASLSGKRMVPIVGGIDFQELQHGNVAAAEEFLVSMQAIDNFRLSLLGIENGGLFQKKSHMLQDEQETGDAATKFKKIDGLTLRRRACDIINSIWPLGIWVEDTKIDNEQPIEAEDGDIDSSGEEEGDNE